MTEEFDLPPLRILPKNIEASTFNSVRLALKRGANPLRMSLVGHRGLDVVLHDDRWWCVDTVHGDVPILVWRDFAAQRRAALHRPIECRLYLYHLHAGLIMGTALEHLADMLTALLRERASTGSRPIRTVPRATHDGRWRG
jgi:hypothetical protein